jgi:hypothetical protein
MARLCTAQMTLTNALGSESGRLSMSAVTKASLVDWVPSRDQVRQWSCAFDDWVKLQTYLRASLAPRLAREATAYVPVVLIFARHASARFDEITQTLNWPLADAVGRWIGLSLDYEGEGNARIPALEQAIRNERFWAVVAIASLRDDRIGLEPYALWGVRQTLLDFAPGARTQDAGMFMAWMRRLASNRTAGPSAFAAISPATDVLLERAWSSVMRRAEAGERATTGSLQVTTELSQSMENAGLAPLAPILSAMDTNNGSCLRAAYAVMTARKARAQLPWMV